MEWHFTTTLEIRRSGAGAPEKATGSPHYWGRNGLSIRFRELKSNLEDRKLESALTGQPVGSSYTCESGHLARS